MSITDLIESNIKNQVEKIRPPEEIREEYDIGYFFQNKVLEIFEIRKDYLNKEEKIQIPVARVMYHKSREKWRIYWIVNEKWEVYKIADVDNLDIFFQILEEDKYGCFWG